MSDRTAGLVLGWMPASQRSATLASRLGFELCLLGTRGHRRPLTAPFRYLSLAVRTWWTVLRRRPRAMIVVAPPFVAPLIVTPLAVALGIQTAVDVHTGALIDRRWSWSVPLLRLSSRLAGTAVVTLPSLAQMLGGHGFRTLVIPDPLPGLTATLHPVATRAGERQVPHVVAVCGWGDDEPLDELVAAAAERPWNLVLTGQPRRSIELPHNVTASGFLDDQTYVRTLASADLVIVLTKRDHTLLSGAWEAIALGQPLIVSATPALRETLGPEIAGVGSTPAEIRRAIEDALGAPAETRARSVAARERFGRDNDAALADLRTALLPRP